MITSITALNLFPDMEADSKRRQVSLDQLNALLGFLKDHQELAKGLTRGRRGKLHTLKLWNLCAKKLNTYKDGAHKDGKGWSKVNKFPLIHHPIWSIFPLKKTTRKQADEPPDVKWSTSLINICNKLLMRIHDHSECYAFIYQYWCDWKYRVRRRALELKAAQDSNRPPPDGITALSTMEENIMSIIGENSLEGVIIKCDPLGEEETFDEANNKDNHYQAPSFQHSVPEPRHRLRKRRHSSRDASDLIDVDSESASTPPERKPRINSKNTEDSDEDDAAQFLQLERQKLDTSQSIRDSLKTIASEITRLTDIMSHIKDVLVNRINI